MTASFVIAPLSPNHDRQAFSCGVDPLDRTTGVGDLLGRVQPADKINHEQAQATAKVRTMGGLRLIPLRVGRAKADRSLSSLNSASVA